MLGALERDRLSVVGGLQARDIELDHLHHRLRHPSRLLRIWIGHVLAEHARNDLPGEPKLVVEPSALLLGATLAQSISS